MQNNNRQSNLNPSSAMSSSNQGPSGSQMQRPQQLYGGGPTSASQLAGSGSVRAANQTQSPQSPTHHQLSRAAMLYSAQSHSHQSTGKTGNNLPASLLHQHHTHQHQLAPHHQKESTMITAFNNILKQLPSSHLNNKNMIMIASPMQQTQCDLSAEGVDENGGISSASGINKFGLGSALNMKKSQQPQQPQQRFEVYMRCVTWGRDSHGLFDYESRQIAKRNIKSYTGGKIIRLNNDVEFISRQSSAAEYGADAKPLIIVHEKNGKFYVENDTLVPIKHEEVVNNGAVALQQPQFDEDVNNKMFIVVRNLKSSSTKTDYRLKKGDIIKLGRIKFKVKDFRTDLCQANIDGKKGNAMSPSPFEKGKGAGYQEEEYWVGGDDFSEEAIEIDCGVVDSTQSDIQCKVCWSNEQSNTNPLLNSCKCDGSVRFIHYECLKHWLKQKMQKKEEGNLISYTWKQFECEICKKPYPYIFKSNGRKYRLVDVDVPENDRKFLWLESLTFEKNSSRMVHLIMPDEQHPTFKLGRGHESDVRVSDISVSRCHAILKYDFIEHSYYLEDNLSKFGTLVLAKQAIELDVNQTQAVQIGRSVISFTVKPMNFNPQAKVQSPRPIEKSEEVNIKSKIEEAQNKLNKIISQTAVVQREHYEPIGPRPAQSHPSDLRLSNQAPSQSVLEDPVSSSEQYYDLLFQQSSLQQQQIQELARQVESLDNRQVTRQQNMATHALQYSSPQRQIRGGTVPQLESPQDDLVEEENMRTQYKPSRGGNAYLHSGRSHAKANGQQNMNHLLAHPDFLSHDLSNLANSPFLLSHQQHLGGAGTLHYPQNQQAQVPHFVYQGADKPSITFQQLQGKYSNQKSRGGAGHHHVSHQAAPGRSSAIGHATRSALMQYSFEDVKEGDISQSGERMGGFNDHESLLVPAEEIEEEAPLRIRTIQYDTQGNDELSRAANNNVISIDLNKYIKQNGQQSHGAYQQQQQQFNGSQRYSKNEDTYQNLAKLLSEVTDNDLRRELEEVGQHQIYLLQQNQSPRRRSGIADYANTGSKTGPGSTPATAVGEYSTSNNFTGVYSHWQNLQSHAKKQQQSVNNSIPQRQQTMSSDKYNLQHQRHSDNSRANGIQLPNTQMNSGSSSNNGIATYQYNRGTSSQSPWRMLVAEAVDAVDRYEHQACVITPIKNSKKNTIQTSVNPHGGQKQQTIRPQTAGTYSGHGNYSPTKISSSQQNPQASYGNTAYTPSKVGKSSSGGGVARDQHSGSRGTAQKVASGMGSYYNTAQKRRQQQQQQQVTSKVAQPLTYAASGAQNITSQYYILQNGGNGNNQQQQSLITPFSKQSMQNHREQQQIYSHQSQGPYQDKTLHNNNHMQTRQ